MRVMAGTGQSIEVCLSHRLSLIILDCVEWVLQLNAGTMHWRPFKGRRLVVVLVVMTRVKWEPNTNFDPLHLLRSSASSSSHREYSGLI